MPQPQREETTPQILSPLHTAMPLRPGDKTTHQASSPFSIATPLLPRNGTSSSASGKFGRFQGMKKLEKQLQTVTGPVQSHTSPSRRSEWSSYLFLLNEP
ncbi:uncharacterized protein TRUGW13939_09330 [Talaromyces rugulosus]|uniref:Uncharacterized protein n=1 Tax=Talaromyces rugulosus TaxID=121627 RepID=A0A7H8R728_TALRU|nr:uncharacterized protein TRUGW13939_09330 [Talaromyces rugulosus]QKX62172.1 hypothetical protein TRUGW13939_09330 [Talaromyces rugulosus]